MVEGQKAQDVHKLLKQAVDAQGKMKMTGYSAQNVTTIVSISIHKSDHNGLVRIFVEVILQEWRGEGHNTKIMLCEDMRTVLAKNMDF